MTVEKQWFQGSYLPIVLVMGFLGFIFVYIGIVSGDVRPIIVVAVFGGIFAAVYFYAKRPGTVIGYPDRPSWTPGRPGGRGAGARIVIIPRNHCQFKGCESKASLTQCKRCGRTYCAQHLREHDCKSLLRAD